MGTDRAPALSPLCVAEIGRDLLGFAARDAKHLANEAMALVWCVVAGSADATADAFALAAQAARLDLKLNAMISDLDAKLAEVVAIDGEVQRSECGTRTH